MHEPISGRAGYCSVPFKIPWPGDALQADAYIRYGEEEVEKFTVRNWAGAPNWRIAVDHFFDPELKFLRRTLKTNTESEAFEHAIVRLLNTWRYEGDMARDGPAEESAHFRRA